MELVIVVDTSILGSDADREFSKSVCNLSNEGKLKVKLGEKYFDFKLKNFRNLDTGFSVKDRIELNYESLSPLDPKVIAAEESVKKAKEALEAAQDALKKVKEK